MMHLREYINNLEPSQTVNLVSVIGQGAHSVVWSTDNPDLAVKLLKNRDQFPKEHESYITASRYGFGPFYHGWCRINNKLFHLPPQYGIIIQRLNHHFDTNDLENIHRLISLLESIASSGYFCADFHTKNLMLTDTFELKLIDPTLLLTREFIETQVTKGKLEIRSSDRRIRALYPKGADARGYGDSEAHQETEGPVECTDSEAQSSGLCENGEAVGTEAWGQDSAGLCFDDSELHNISVGLMLDYITHPSFGGLPLSRCPEYSEALVQYMKNKPTLRFIFKTCSWSYSEWEPY